MRFIKIFKSYFLISFFSSTLLSKFFSERYDFAWVIHSRNEKDFYNYFSVTKYLPTLIVRLICKRIWPFMISDITDTKDKDGKELRGCIIGVPLLPEQILKNRKLAIKRINQALKLAERIGVRNVSLGAYNSSVTKGGEKIYKESPVFLTSGYVFLSVLAGEVIDKISTSYGRKKNGCFCIVGATTIPGKALAKLLIVKGVKNLLLIGKNIENLENLKKECQQLKKEKDIKINYSNDINKGRFCSIIVLATNKKSVLLPFSQIKKDTLIFDITQPNNPSINILKKRKDIKVFSKLALTTPDVNYHFNFDLPPEQAYPCLAEAILLTKEKRKDHFGIGDISMEQVDEITKLAKKYNFEPVVFDSNLKEHKLTWD